MSPPAWRAHKLHRYPGRTRVRGRRDSRKNHNAAPGNRYLSRATLLGDGCVGGPDLCITRADDMRHALSRAQGLPNLSPRPVCGTLDFQRPGNACFLLLASRREGLFRLKKNTFFFLSDLLKTILLGFESFPPKKNTILRFRIVSAMPKAFPRCPQGLLQGCRDPPWARVNLGNTVGTL